MSTASYCPLCASNEIEPYHRDRRRAYLACTRCDLVFVPPAYYLSREQERAEYDLHQNRVDDPGYRSFLGRLATPLQALLPPGARGLDFGCGPAPALVAMLREGGFEMSLYDSFFWPGTGPLACRYDFITATEVVEHLHRPGAELARLWDLLHPGGILGVMTKRVRDRDAFAGWHYKNDPTHVCFFSARTWRWWALERGAQLSLPAADVALLQKPG